MSRLLACLLAAPLALLLIAASPPLPKNVKIGAEDYPEAAREAGVEGDVRFTLAIDAKGRVSDCRVTASSAASLAEGTCALARARWKYDPARDDAGAKVPGEARYSIAWRIILPCPKPDGETLCVFL